MAKTNFLISLTSIPRRFDGSLLEVLAALKQQSLTCKILVNIPTSYRKWGAVHSIPTDLQNIENVIVFSPKEDYGPATKLLGGLEYIRDRPEITHIITVDDDMLIDDTKYLEYLAAHAAVLPDYVITIGGVKLDRFPFKSRNGLILNSRFMFVDAPAGYRGVLYPTRLLRDNKLPFEFFDKLPPGVINDDDAYFGVILSVLNIPLFAIPRRPGGSEVKASKQEGGSAVAELVDIERTQNEMEIYQYAVSKGYFLNSRNNASRRLNITQRLGLITIHFKERFRQIPTLRP